MPISPVGAATGPDWAALLQALAVARLSLPGVAPPAPVDVAELSIVKLGLAPELLRSLGEAWPGVGQPLVAETAYLSAQSAALQNRATEALSQLEKAFAADLRYLTRAVADPVFQPHLAAIAALIQHLASVAESGVETSTVAPKDQRPQQPGVVHQNPPSISQLGVSGSPAALEVRKTGSRPPGPRTGSRAWTGILQAASRTARRVKSLWSRFPLLVLMLTWFALGLAGLALRSVAFPALRVWTSIWAMGLLFLVILGWAVSLYRSTR